MGEWRLALEVAGEVRNWYFHPAQTTPEEVSDGITLSFTAGETAEICNHLFRWDDKVQIIFPEALRGA